MVSRILTVLTVVALVFALNVSGALAGFWRTFDGMTSNGVLNPSQFLYGVGMDDTTLGIYGYGYGYGYGDFNAGNPVATTGGSGGGGSSSSSHNSSSNDDGNSNNNNEETSSNNENPSNNEETNNNESPSNEQTPTTPVTENLNTGISGTDAADTVRNEGACTFPGVAPEYTDIADSWARSYIRDLSKRGIMNGVSSTLLNPTAEFEPNRATTRIEFLKIALRTFCYEYTDLAGNENFGDVADNSWQAKVVELAGALGVINTSNADFRPNDAISKIEATKMILNIGATRSVNFGIDASLTSSAFSDISVVWMAKYAERARTLGIVSGNNGRFEPLNAISRAQTAKIAVRSMNAQ